MLDPSPASVPALPESTAPAPPAERGLRGLRHLGLVLWVALSYPILGSLRALAAGDLPLQLDGYRLWASVASEVSALLVLWYVLARQGRSWKDIGWAPRVLDIPAALGMLLAVTIATTIAWVALQYSWTALSGTILPARSPAKMLQLEPSAPWIVFLCVNAFFEELIVRAYTMSEVVRLGGSMRLAVVVSVVVQMSYHLYQGIANGVMLAVTFLLLSLFYVRTRRIAPIVLVHLMLDLAVLLRSAR